MKRISTTSTAISVVYGVVLSTGLLTIALGMIARLNDTSLVEYYQYVFPRFRGGAVPAQIPGWGYVVFVLYTGAAAAIAVHTRKRIEAGQRRRTR